MNNLFNKEVIDARRKISSDWANELADYLPLDLTLKQLIGDYTWSLWTPREQGSLQIVYALEFLFKGGTADVDKILCNKREVKSQSEWVTVMLKHLKDNYQIDLKPLKSLDDRSLWQKLKNKIQIIFRST